MHCPRCQKTVDEHPAGPCMDAWLCEAVLGIPVVPEDHRFGPYPHCTLLKTCLIRFDQPVGGDVPTYHFQPSTSWEGMRQVVEAMTAAGWDYEHHSSKTFGPGKTHYVWLTADDRELETWGYADADSAPLAVARAALKTMEKQK